MFWISRVDKRSRLLNCGGQKAALHIGLLYRITWHFGLP